MHTIEINSLTKYKQNNIFSQHCTWHRKKDEVYYGAAMPIIK